MKRTVKRKRLVLKGSYTVEASLLLPMILSVVVMLIYLSFFLHDRAVLSSAAYSAALRGSQMISGEDVFSGVYECSNELVRGRLLGTGDLETEVALNGEKITVSYSGNLKIPMGAVLCRYLIGNVSGIPVEAVSEAKRQDAVKFLRECRVIEHYASSGKGKKSLKEE